MRINHGLMKAACNGKAERVKHCLSQKGCDPMARDEYGRSALMKAAYYGHEACVRLLLPRSDPLVKDNQGYTALMWAAYSGDGDCVKLLLTQSDVMSKNLYGLSASDICIERGYVNVAEMVNVYALAKKEASVMFDDIALGHMLKKPKIRI